MPASSPASALLPPGVTVFERGWLSSNNVLFVGNSGTALVDSGYVLHQTQTLDLVGSQLGNRPLDLLVNTHLHSDHCGGNAALQAQFPALVTLIPPGDAQNVQKWDEDALTYRPTGQICPRFSFTGLLKAGASLRLADRDWEIHSAPGHDPHSIILFEPISKCLISADALWQNGFGVVFPELDGVDGFRDVAQTLDVIESLSPSAVIPGHGPVFTDCNAAIQSARRRLLQFEADPSRHTAHALKVLLKFKLLQTQSMTFAELFSWAAQTGYLAMKFDQTQTSGSFESWVLEIARALEKSGAALIQDDTVANA